MNASLFFAALRARIGVFGLVLAATLLATLLISLLVPKTYRATASVVVDTEQEQSLNNALAPARDRISYIQTQADILASERVARKVVRDLRLAEDPVARAAFDAQTGGRGRIEDWLVANLLQNLEVDSTQSNVIRVSFSSRSARTAAATANGFAEAFVATVLDLRVEPMRSAATWFDEQLKTLRANLEQAQRKLADYHRQHGIVSADERNDVEYTRMGELSSQLARTQDQSLDLETRARQAREFLARGGSPEQLPDVQANPQVQALQTELLQGDAKLRELGSQYGVNHPTYQRQLAENRGRRATLYRLTRSIVAGFENAGRQSRLHEDELASALATQRAHLLGLKEGRNDLEVLMRNVEAAQKTYEAASQRFVVSQVESRANRANVAMLSAAAVPRVAHFPKVGLNMALALVVGTALGFGAVVFLELNDRRIRSLMELDRDVGVPLLGIIHAWHPGVPQLPGARKGIAGLLPILG